MKAKVGTKAQAKAGLQSKAKVGTKAQAKAGLQSKVKLGTKAQTKAGLQSKAKTGTKAQAKAGLQSKAKVGTKAQAKAGLQSKAKVGTKAQAKAGLQSKAKVGTKAQAKAGLQSKAKVGTKAQAKAQSKAQAKATQLKKRAKQLPSLPGVYLMKKNEKQILYIGKANSLKSRVESYFNKTSSSLKTEFLMSQTEQIDYILTENEVEAFLLEAVLIKKHKPRYNVRLKDDKSYPYIRFSAEDKFPRFYFERRVKKSKDIYFGPYTEGFTVRALLDFLNQNFNLRDCSDSEFKNRKRPCLTFDIGICPAPCVKKISEEEYKKNCQKALSFLKGRSKSLLKQLQKEIQKASDELKFEWAGQLRDRLQAIERIELSQVIYQKSDKDKDIVALQSSGRSFLIEILHFRKGRLIGNRFQFFKNRKVQEEILLSFLNQYYSENLIPDELAVKLPIKVSKLKILEKVLSRQKKSACKVLHRLTPEDSLLVKRAETNAHNHLINEINKLEDTQELLKEIQRKFHLQKLPIRMECYDISHWQGHQSVGSGVVFESAQAYKKDYRLYNLKTVSDGDDYQALKEVLSRRLKHKEYKKPDLILIDGGKGQLKAVKKILTDLNKTDWSVVSLAKDRLKESENYAVQTKSTGERFYLPGRKNPVIFPAHSKALKILLHLRDEAHRFAISSHRKKRDKNFLKGDLDSIKGLSPQIKQKLLKHCGSIEGLKKMTEQELFGLSFISKALAKKIKQFCKTRFDT